MKKIISILLFTLILTGCGSDISTVKDGAMHFDNSITVGDAFDKYGYFKSTDWSSFETANGRSIVEVTGVFTDNYPLFQQLNEKGVEELSVSVQFKINIDDSFEISAIAMNAKDSSGKEAVEDIGSSMSEAQLDQFLEELYNDEPLS